MARKSYRNRFWEDNKAVKIPCNNRKGYKVIYEYTGNFIAWETVKHNFFKYKAWLLLLEVISVVLFVFCATVNTSINRTTLAGGFGIMALIPWMFEFSGIIRFIVASKFVPEMSGQEIDKSIRAGSIMRGIIEWASGIGGITQIIISGTISLLDGVVFLGICLSSSAAFFIYRNYIKQEIVLYRNTEGKAGKRY